ncbi:sulfur oxidation c-type cytochrome SoxA [Belnapia rosea]|uniref:sulfur oxidation c-type cytochrome SoxA n=1 Tax=Belnapia rosea TaxID=938405 RepID=UPI0008880602|nr:sulfur oxidation c-type cytochrome SoxA [Belnapia rosea]SDB73541.1 sulfur-oxidizing protein SoxA [Belnapia rosea]
MRRLLLALLLAGVVAEARESGFVLMSPETQAMQRDDTANPGMLWVEEGRALWDSTGCASCHGDVAGMRGVAARYPAFDAASGGPIDLAGRIAQCQEARQGRTPFPRESEEALALSALIGLQSRGMPISPSEDPRLAPALARGEALYRQRRGQLDLSCAQCHDANAGRHLGSSPIPEAHPTGYPLYRLEWQGMGSLQRRLRNCMAGVRSEPYAYGAAEYVEIELFLMRRAAGMPLETPAVRP